MEVRSGKVLWFNEVKGYGFIQQDSGGSDLFVHFRDIHNTTRTLSKDQDVFYTLHESEKGPVAKEVEVKKSV